MRRLRNSRAPEPDESAIEGFDRMDLEGDAIGPVVDEIAWLRPFGADIPGPVLASTSPESEPEAEVEAAWAEEIERRAREIDSGKVRTIPWEQVRAQLHGRLGEKR